MKILKNYPEVLTNSYRFDHQAIDIVGDNDGTHVLDYITSFENGKIIELRNDATGFEDNGSYGNYILIDHLNGYFTRYAHLAYNSINKSLNDYVNKGEVIGYMGATGYAFGGHLHFEIIKDGIKIDPTDYIFSNKEIIEKKTNENINPNLIFICPEDGLYYIKLNKNNKLYYKE